MKPENCDHLYLVYYFPVPLKAFRPAFCSMLGYEPTPFAATMIES